MENIKDEVTVRNIEDDLSYIKDRGRGKFSREDAKNLRSKFLSDL